jgi:citrate synthase
MKSSDEVTLLNARETAARLGIKLETLYAYVSRGLLHSVGVRGSRARYYRVEDVDRFRLSRGRGDGPEALTPIIDSAVCLIEGGHFYYRGIDAVALADTATLEDVAALLWNDDAAAQAALPTRPGRGPALSPAAGGTGTAKSGLIERCQKRLATLAGEDLAALDLTSPGVARTGRRILAELAGCIAAETPPADPVHRRLAQAWQLDEAGADLIRRCLVLLADHELNASTFVARCVASTGATPYAVVAAALAALSGRRHGGASARAEALLRELGREADPMAVMAARLARGEDLPGLGHPLYPAGDPRAAAMVEALARARPEEGARAAAIAVAAIELTGQYPNVDFALGAATSALGLPQGSALALFLVGRTVGWLAHAIEQYDSRVLIRPRARYTGRRPVSP